MPEPLVSALVAAYNAEPYIEEALRSALDQDWPNLEVVVVDDGSTDGTAAVVERLGDPRIRLIRQANAGACGAVNTALAAARGEVLALLDADDVWPAGKLRAQWAVLEARPEVGLVYGDMTVIDAAGRVLHESFLDGDLPPQGRCLSAMLESNDATASSVLWRRALAAPIPPEVPYTDWWFAVRAAERSEIAYLPEPRTLYRFHGGNLTLGTEGPARERELRKAIAFRLWFLRRLEPGALSPHGLANVWRAVELNAAEIDGDPYAGVGTNASALGDARGVTVIEPGDGAADRAAGEAALRCGEPVAAAGRLSRALAHDPTDAALREALIAAFAAAPGGESRAGQAPLAGAHERVVLAFADELIARPQLLAAYAARMAGAEDITLAIDATALTDAEAELGALVERVPAAAGCDLLAVLGPLDAVGRARLAAGVDAVLSDRPLELSAPRL